MSYPPTTDVKVNSNLLDLGALNNKIADLEARVAILEVASAGNLPVGSHPKT